MSNKTPISSTLKSVVLHEWWLTKVEGGSKLAVGGIGCLARMVADKGRRRIQIGRWRFHKHRPTEISNGSKGAPASSNSIGSDHGIDVKEKKKKKKDTKKKESDEEDVNTHAKEKKKKDNKESNEEDENADGKEKKIRTKRRQK
ncbi:hypothetical protein Tco_0209839 [Tanacetum coccineum]